MSANDLIPACVCSAHPKGTDKRKWMRVAQCTNEFVVFVCQRCSEICHTPVIQVRTLRYARDRARYIVEQQRRQLDPRTLAMLQRGKRGSLQLTEGDTKR